MFYESFFHCSCTVVPVFTHKMLVVQAASVKQLILDFAQDGSIIQNLKEDVIDITLRPFCTSIK